MFCIDVWMNQHGCQVAFCALITSASLMSNSESSEATPICHQGASCSSASSQTGCYSHRQTFLPWFSGIVNLISLGWMPGFFFFLRQMCSYFASFYLQLASPVWSLAVSFTSLSPFPVSIHLLSCLFSFPSLRDLFTHPCSILSALHCFPCESLEFLFSTLYPALLPHPLALPLLTHYRPEDFMQWAIFCWCAFCFHIFPLERAMMKSLQRLISDWLG